ncbi:hypothetical protein ACX0G7_09505 [Flavitalea antarctica]
METRINKEYEQMLLEELKSLDSQAINIDGNTMKPSQCYHWESDPAHLLYNTNCPPDLKQKLQAIIAKYVDTHETRTS